MSKSNIAFDASEAALSIKKTPQGYLRVEGRCMKPGVSSYWDPSTGKIERRLRLPEDVFEDASLDSYEGIPVTDEHPCLLDASNTKFYARGNVGRGNKHGDYVKSRMLITDAGLIAKVESRNGAELSPAYKFKREEKPGTYNGQHYDVICRKIRLNHLAVTEAGRQGSDIALIMDSDVTKKVPGLSYQVTQEQELSLDSKDKRVNTVKIKLAGKTVEVEDGVAELVSSELKDAKEAKEELTASLDSAKGALDKATKELKAATDPAAFLKRVNERVALVEKSRKVLGSKVSFDSLSDVEIMTKALSRVQPELKLEGRDESYIAAAFDIAMDAADEKSKKTKAASEDEEGDESDEDTSTDSDGDEDDSQDSDEDEFTARSSYCKGVADPKNHYQKPVLS